MDIITLEELKLYLRIDSAEEDGFLQLCIDNAEGFLTDSIDDFATKINNERFKNKAKLLMMRIVLDMYDNRQMSTKDNEEYKLLFQSFLLQMQYGTYEVPETTV
ncbi:MAG: head-tail connector protein [Lachnospiraceae bacterium]|nr:head-tail connector protein [Lachnospiraceae bacterium]